MSSQRCSHGSWVDEDCLCDILWRGEACDERDCQGGTLRSDGACECSTRHVGDFCEYLVCYHRDTLYCWGLKDVRFEPCQSDVLEQVEHNETRNADPAWACPCEHGRRTKPPLSRCSCHVGYGGELCTERLCGGGDGDLCGSAGGRGMPDTLKIASVCMSVVVLVALVFWLKKVCKSRDVRRRLAAASGSSVGQSSFVVGRRSDIHQLRVQVDYDPFQFPPMTTGHPDTPLSRPPSYEEAGGAPPPYCVAVAASMRQTADAKSAANAKPINAKSASASSVDAKPAQVRESLYVDQRSMTFEPCGSQTSASTADDVTVTANVNGSGGRKSTQSDETRRRSF